MRARVLLWTSLGLNILLAVTMVWLSRNGAERFAAGAEELGAEEASVQFKTNVVVRRQGFHWSEIESADFPAYIANLRRIGCPERTIRDIIVADVNDLYSERMAREIILPEQKWWLPDPDKDAVEAGMNQLRALEQEKQQLLTQLLGPEWESQRSAVAASAFRFDGAVLSGLPPEIRSVVERIETNARRARAEVEERARQEGREADAVELSRLGQETRRELAAILAPEQLEEYLLRYSDTADRMREELRGFGGDADEFRRIFRVRDSFDQEIAALNLDDPSSAARRAELERLREDAVRQQLAPERFNLYQLSQSALFRQAQDQAEQAGAPPETVLPLYRVNEAAQEEIARIQTDTTISEDQRRVALATIQQQHRNSVERILANEPAEMVSVPDTATQVVPQPPPLPPLPPEAFGAPARSRGPVDPRRR